MNNAANLRELLFNIASNHLSARKDPFKEHPHAKMIRSSRDLLSKIIPYDLEIKGSPGQGDWNHVPWIAIIDKRHSSGPQEGVYVVYLFSSDMKRLYLTLNQGVERLVKQYKTKKAVSILKNTAQNIRLFNELPGYHDDNNLSLDEKGNGKLYEVASIYYIEYDPVHLPKNEELQYDLINLIEFYIGLMVKDNFVTSNTVFEKQYKNKADEGRRILISHYRYERNPKLVQDFKRMKLDQNGELRCEACGFSFPEIYGERGEGYIEVHHKTPISNYSEVKTTDFSDLSLVCSNCHKMIHRRMPYLSMEKLLSLL